MPACKGCRVQAAPTCLHDDYAVRAQDHKAEIAHSHQPGDLQYNREHPGAGKAGKGDSRIDSMLCVGGGRHSI